MSNDGNEFKKPCLIWPTVAQLIFWARAALNQRIKDCIDANLDQNVRKSIYEHLLVFEHKYVEENQPTACGALFTLYSDLVKADKSCQPIMRIKYVKESNFTSINFDGKQISFIMNSHAYFGSLSRIHQLLSNLLCGFAVDQAVFEPRNIQD
ncbi:hypothetical protein H4S08_002983 [Coemansia sp. RSA 1365]|nr:hypothetical protein H4S08_002983 [Coemansia sp. RSA 1365]